jgi:exopolyphosphatase/guanosine-5'-triphosphate,3'-diphosphate pyrophosphatase
MEAGMEGFDREMIESLRLSRQRVGEWQLRLWGLPLAQRKLIPGLPANRADVILMGTAVYAAVMTTFHVEELRISTRGLRFAAVR